MPTERQAQVLRFGVFEVNLFARELRKNGFRVRLPRQPFAILAMLPAKHGEVLTREEIRHPVFNEVFWGLWLFPFGLLVYKSRFLPRILGVWLMLNCFAYLATSVTGILWPQYEQRVSN